MTAPKMLCVAATHRHVPLASQFNLLSMNVDEWRLAPSSVTTLGHCAAHSWAGVPVASNAAEPKAPRAACARGRGSLARATKKTANLLEAFSVIIVFVL